MYFFPIWLTLACLAASGLAAYLALEGRVRGWALYVLTVLLAPVVLLAAFVAALVLSSAISVAGGDDGLTPETRDTGPSAPAASPAPTEATVPETTVQRTASPSASPTASPAASPSASPSASP